VRFRQLGLVVAFITSLMLVIDNNIVIVALPDMPRSLHFCPANLSFVVTGYALSFAGFILLSGKVGSIIEAKRALTIGTPVFIGPSRQGDSRRTPSVLITARVVQCVGGAIAAPSTPVLLAANTESGPQRTRALGLFVLSRASGGAIGLILPGVLTTSCGWTGSCSSTSPSERRSSASNPKEADAPLVPPAPVP
jgi:MFS family permease